MKQESRTNINRVKKDISSPESFTPPEELKRQLITTMQSIYDEEDIEAVERAYKVAYKAHEKQKRKSGEPYIIHPICVAIILAELELDKETIMAGLLHDVVEDTETTHEDIVRDFGEEVAQLVDGVTKLGQLSYSKDKIEVQAENLRKMFLAMAKDIRVILIKLADRLHNMRTMQFMRPEKQKEKSRETMDIYAPIAHRLGISKIKVELDDLALCYLKPDVYEDLEKSLNSAKEEREAFIQEIVEEVKGHIDRAGIKAEIDGRVKHMFSIYKKMVNQHKTIDQIYDLFAVRIKVDTVKDCYAALGIIHEMYKPIPGRFKDYIAMPKPNMYQSLHTTLIGPEGHPFEIQIRTFEMHRVAEYGIAAHWKYKENNNTKGLNKEEEKLSWLREVLEWQRDMDDNKEFLSLLKTNLDLFAEQVYCFTPNGDVKNLANGSTPIDFAYSIHSAVGNKMVGARVNGRQVPFDYHLQNGDRVEIITSQNSKGPSRDWLGLVKSAQARSKINQWFKRQFKEENIVRGKELLEKYCKSKSIRLSELMKPEYGYRLMDNYKDIFTLENEGNAETIWACLCSRSVNQQMWLAHVISSEYPTKNPNIQKWGGYRVLWDFYHTFDSADKRLEVLVGDFVAEDGTHYNEENPGSVLIKGAMPVKYGEDPDATGEESQVDWIVYRYADVLTLLAEAIVREGNTVTPEAVELLNMVHTRAGLPAYTMADFAGADAFLEAVLTERGHELWFEGVRRSDLIRYGRYIEYARKYKQSPTAQDYMTLMPLPQSVIDESKGKIIQNPGY